MNTTALGGANAASPPMRDGSITIDRLIDLYFDQYTGRDTTRAQRLNWWRGQIGAMRCGGPEQMARACSRAYSLATDQPSATAERHCAKQGGRRRHDRHHMIG